MNHTENVNGCIWKEHSFNDECGNKIVDNNGLCCSHTARKCVNCGDVATHKCDSQVLGGYCKNYLCDDCKYEIINWMTYSHIHIFKEGVKKEILKQECNKCKNLFFTNDLHISNISFVYSILCDSCYKEMKNMEDLLRNKMKQDLHNFSHEIV